MRNPFVAMAVAAAASLQAFRHAILTSFNKGEHIEPERPTSYARKTGLMVAAAKRAAIKTRNQARHKAACRG